MESFDQSLKYLLHHAPAAFIGFGLGEPAVRILAAVPTVLPARGRDVDGAYLVARPDAPAAEADAAGADPRVVHVEMHRRHQAAEELSADVAEAQIRLFRRERRLVISHVWDLYGSPGDPVLEERTFVYGEAGSRCVYLRVNLRGLASEELLARAPPALWSLVALTRDGAEEAALARTRDAIDARAALTSRERADHLAVLWFVAEAEGVPGKLMRAVLSKERLMESELYREISGMARRRERPWGRPGERPGEKPGERPRASSPSSRLAASP